MWVCAKCETSNSNNAKVCEVCDFPRSATLSKDELRAAGRGTLNSARVAIRLKPVADIKAEIGHSPPDPTVSKTPAFAESRVTSRWAVAFGCISGIAFIELARLIVAKIIGALQLAPPDWLGAGVIAWLSVAGILIAVTVTALLTGKMKRAGKAVMCAIGLTLAFACLIALTPHTGGQPSTIQPSFNCANAKSVTEIEICNDKDLAALDASMADAYHHVLDQLPSAEKARFRRQHLDWFKQYQQSCNALVPASESVRECISKALADRTRQLRALANRSSGQGRSGQDTKPPVLTAPNTMTVFRDELSGSSSGDAHGVRWTHGLGNHGALFSANNSSRIEYPNQVPAEGTIEFWIKVDSGYGYDNYVFKWNREGAMIFSTDVQGGDVTWPGTTKLFVYPNGNISFFMATTKYNQPPAPSTEAIGTGFRFGVWHALGVSYGGQGQYIMVDGQIVAAAPNRTQQLGRAGTHQFPADIPTIGATVSHYWGPHQYEGGFEGTVAMFRTSTRQQDWYLARGIGD